MSEQSEKQIDLYPTYEEAKKATQRLGIKTKTDYWSKRENDSYLPINPYTVYQKRGWKSWNDLLGIKEPSKPRKSSRSFYPTYKEAQKAVEALGIQSRAEYKKRYKEDFFLPSTPDLIYEGWISWIDFLKTNNVVQSSAWFYPTYEEARVVAHSLCAKTKAQYKENCKRDSRLPSNPSEFYQGKGWIGWPDFLGISPMYRFYATYEEAKLAAQSFGFKTSDDYHRGSEKDSKLHGTPHVFYQDRGWTCWGDFLGTNNSNKGFLCTFYTTYAEAKEAVYSFGFKTIEEYRAGYKEDLGLPSNPNAIYKGKGWINWSLFLGSKRSPRRSRDLFYKTYEEAQKEVQALGIKTRAEYIECAKENTLLCIDPSYTYKGIGWIGWPDFLGISPIYRFYATYEEAKNAVRALGITTMAQYLKDYKNDSRLPSNPNAIYKGKGWINGYDFCGTKSPTKNH